MIAAAAARVAAAEDRRRRLREEVMVARRDAIKLLAYLRSRGPDVPALDDAAQALTARVPVNADAAALATLLDQARRLLERLQPLLCCSIPDGTAARNERHHQNTEEDSC